MPCPFSLNTWPFCVTAGGRLEIVAWLLSYGRHAELLEPAELRAEVAQQVQEMVSRYAL